jgi:peptidyl-prolyl cis-trans isomerase D
LTPLLFNAEVGKRIGPLVDGNSVKMARLMEIGERPDSLKARHILIAFQGALRAAPEVTITKEEAKLRADSLLTVVKKDTTRFSALAAALQHRPRKQRKWRIL